MSLSVAIPCFNQGELLPELLASLAGCPAAEILVLDDGSTPPVVLGTGDDRVRVVRHLANRGLAVARTTLAREARGELILFLDADVVLTGWSETAVRAFAAAPELAALTGRALEDGSGSAANRWRRWFWVQDHGPEAGEVPYAYGLCCLWRRQAVLDLGGFDQRLRSHGEDLDLSFRACARGLAIRHDPALTVVHRRRDSLASLLRMVWHHAYWFSVVCRAHRQPLYARGLVNALTWLPITVASSLRRHRDLRLAAISLPAGVVSIAARLWAVARPGPLTAATTEGR
jgi:GT2 family glycosyltransferase